MTRLGAPGSTHTMSGTRDPTGLLDVDVDQLARPLALIAPSRFETEPAELAHPDPGQDPGHGRERHPEALGDLRAGEPQPAQGSDRLDSLFAGSMRDPMRGR